jgi:hypothetical protein
MTGHNRTFGAEYYLTTVCSPLVGELCEPPVSISDADFTPPGSACCFGSATDEGLLGGTGF